MKADLTIPKTREYYVSVDFILPLKDNVAASVPFISLNDSPENIFFIGQLNAGLNKVTIYMHPLDKGNQIKVEVYDVKPGAISPGVFLLKKQHLTQQ
ncbi:hypothetical protein A2870_00530 [Candidatus Curtissbacteria bacterium RIFCSPHIGHO2_01_FULL_41_11]|uniref:Uncharacterized protein n=1 Tax=Candidatus Curtissbacteria bacterium RIFCSPHIGHO2_01_FULL_41_11 TaxID=1797711 RepID=A0A1F5G859_9BACT|nr:MAG: hypothetical protein A2870_00530 [Candidatus Curtissbacteria bacterium RIFCSPHIGHO2_01_FULL_41_11]